MIRIIDLFSGIGGIRLGLEQAIVEAGEVPVCVFSSEIKESALKIFHQNHPSEIIYGDITSDETKSHIPDFDILCAGFPCQAFSSAGNRKGFADTRGTLFFEVETILKMKNPSGFILENVEGLVNHQDGDTLATIINHLEALEYKVNAKVLNSKDFGVAQERKRIYIVGTKTKKVSLDDFPVKNSVLGDILETGLPTVKSKFIDNLLAKYKPEDLYGKSIKDKRGGSNNIHSWELEIKGPVTEKETNLLNLMVKERRKKKWAEEWNIDWMDGMPLTESMIQTFYSSPDLHKMLEKLTEQGYLTYEHPKQLIKAQDDNGHTYTYRQPDVNKPKGYNIVAGKLSFEVSKILDPNDITPTLVAMDMQKLFVIDGRGLRTLTLREGLRLCGYPDDFKFEIEGKDGYDLIGNTVVVPVIKAVSSRLIKTIWQK